MLYDIMFAVLIAYTMVSPLVVVKSIKYGIKLADKPKETAETPMFNVPKKKKKPKMSKEDERIINILANIDAYDGTSVGQKEIK